MSIYTKTGDDGTTSLANGTRVAKNHIRVESYGTIDELNAHIALLESLIENEALKRELRLIQDNLFIIQTHLAMGGSDMINHVSTNILEQQIDAMNEKLPKLHSFVYLGGHPTVAACHIARCVCRRAERILITLSEEYTVDARFFSYINRLSDYLFVLARYINESVV